MAYLFIALLAAPWAVPLLWLAVVHGRATVTEPDGRVFPSYGDEAARRAAVR
jgi:hypothetical protein